MTTEERLEILEKKLKYTKCYSYFLICGVILAVLSSIAIWVLNFTPRKDIRARQFTLVDEANNTRALLAVDKKNNTVLDMCDEHGKSRVYHRADNRGGVVMFKSSNGKELASLALIDDLFSELFLSEEKGKTSVRLTVETGEISGYTELRLKDSNGYARLDTSKLSFRDKKSERWTDFDISGLTIFGKKMPYTALRSNGLSITTKDVTWVFPPREK